MYAYMLWADTTAGIMKMRNGANSAWISLWELDGTFIATDISLSAGTAGAPSLYFTGDTNTGLFSPGADTVALATAGSNRLHITSAGNVGIGTATPNVTGFGSTVATINIATGSNGGLELTKNNVAAGNFTVEAGASNDVRVGAVGGSAALTFQTGGSERGRFDSSGRLLVGTSTARTNFNTGAEQSHIQLEGTTFNTTNLSIVRNSANDGTAALTLGKSRSATVNGNTVVVSGDPLGFINFEGADGTNMVRGASIAAQVDGTPGANDMPGRLVFSTTADGGASPTERMRISSDGTILFVKTSASFSVAGVDILNDGQLRTTRSGASPIAVNRTTNDGDLVEFYQAGTLEGTISVSGTTVSYNGAHLSRWSQLPSGAERTEILRGSVLSNIDEMCEWTDEENEQLNRMQVSDVEGDKNVSGVFQAWDDDDDTYTNDFYCAMTGDFIIRIAEGVTVERGDLLMSAGDGTAKPQDDDIIRSKTIAKVTSTNVSCTYPDGSYCVPCVLMAC